jgi:hypothetical protein
MKFLIENRTKTCFENIEKIFHSYLSSSESVYDNPVLQLIPIKSIQGYRAKEE